MTYACRFCGHKSSTATGGRCQYSPYGVHEYILAKDFYRCRFCGHASKSASPGYCGKSPFGHHEYL
ncbi:MAG: hypothetical protein Q8O15_02790 [Rectinemataceae bacterium]|nr:hypothetical protein [Rectinemataceae bacterium]